MTGEIVVKNSAYVPGHPVSVFSQSDLESGHVYYQHLRESGSADDMFEFKLTDKQEPPNRSIKYNVHVTVHEVHDTPLQQVHNSAHQALAQETEILYFTYEQVGL